MRSKQFMTGSIHTVSHRWLKFNENIIRTFQIDVQGRQICPCI